MKEIIEWLIGIEQSAGDLYREAAACFAKDRKLAEFLRELAEDEAWHFHVMGSAAEFLRGRSRPMPAQVTLDDESLKTIRALFQQNLEQLAAGQLEKETILSCVAATEFSEWNDLFLYVVNTLKEQRREFQYAAARMQGHLDQIVVFFEARPEGLALLEEIRNLPKLWRGRVLIVEDTEPLRVMLENVLSRQYDTETAENGRAGLEKIKENYFDVIVSDIDMPVMDGITLFQAAAADDPMIAHRFLVLSGYFSDQNRLFLETNHVPYLQKPVVLKDLQKRLVDIVAANRNYLGSIEESEYVQSDGQDDS